MGDNKAIFATYQSSGFTVSIQPSMTSPSIN